MGYEIPAIVEELYMTYGAEEVQRGCPPRPAQAPHALWAFYQGLLVGVRLRAVCAPVGDPPRPYRRSRRAQRASSSS